MPRLERAIAFLLAAAGAGGVLAAASGAGAPSGSWQSPQRVVARGAASLAAVELDDGGDALAVWQDDASAVYASLRPAASRRWQPAVRLSARGSRVDGAPAVAVDRAGDVVIAYYVSNRPAERVEVVTGSMRSGRWRSPRSLGGARAARGPLLVDVRWIGAGIDAAARATVLFRGPERLSVVSGSARTGNWSRPALLPVAARLAQQPQLGVNEHGAAVVAWTRCEPGTRDVCRTGTAARFQAIVRSAPRGAWSPPALVAPPGATGSENIASRLVALTDGGTAVAAWVDGGLWTALRPRSAWQRPLLVTRSIRGGADWEGQRLAFLHADDGALLVWATPRGVLDAQRLDEAGTWSPTGLDRVGAGWGVLAARGPWSVLAWSTESFNAPSSAAVGTDAWQVDPAVGLGDGDLAGAAIDDRGHAVLVWQADSALESALYDPAG